jgi:hypothetical protein
MEMFSFFLSFVNVAAQAIIAFALCVIAIKYISVRKR